MSEPAERDYVLGTHEEEIERLALQHRVWRPSSRSSRCDPCQPLDHAASVVVADGAAGSK